MNQLTLSDEFYCHLSGEINKHMSRKSKIKNGKIHDPLFQMLNCDHFHLYWYAGKSFLKWIKINFKFNKIELHQTMLSLQGIRWTTVLKTGVLEEEVLYSGHFILRIFDCFRFLPIGKSTLDSSITSTFGTIKI